MSLFKFFTRPKMPTTPASRFTETAVDQRLNALIIQMPDPDLTLGKSGLRRQDLRALETDDEISAAIETRREALVSTPWRLEPGKGRAVNFIWEQLTPHLPNILKNAFHAVLYGYNVQEVIYKQLPDGKIGIQSVIEKPFEWFEPKNDGTLIYRNNWDVGVEGVVVDTELKFLLTVRNPSYRNPYGEALLSRLYWPWHFRINAWRFWAKNLERSGIPFLKGTAPDRVDNDGKSFSEHLSEKLATASQDAVLALPDGWTAEFMSVTQTGGSFDQFETAVTKRIQKLILGQTLTSDVGNSGSYAAAKVHDAVRQDRRNADMRLVSITVQTLVNALHSLNGFSGAAPVFIMEDEQGLNLDRAQRDALLVQAGIITLSEDYILRTFDFEAGEITSPTPITPTPITPTPAVAKFSAFSQRNDFTPEQRQIEKLADDMLTHLKPPLQDEAIASAIRGATDPEDLIARLAMVLKDADYAEFTQQVERCLFAADVMGYAHAD